MMKSKQKLLKTGRRGKKKSFPFLPHDKLDPNVYPRSAKQQPLPASEFCTARCRGPAMPAARFWGQTPAATRSRWGRAAHQKAKEQSSPPLASQQCGVASAAVSAHRVLYGSFVLKFPLWASKPPYASTKPLLKIVQDRLRLFFSFSVEPTVPYLLLVLYRWLNDVSAKCILNTFQAFHAKMNRWKNRIFANSADYSFVSR